MVVFLVFLWCQHPARELVLFRVLQDCGVFALLFLVFLWWCFVVVWWCFCAGVFGVFVVVFLVVVCGITTLSETSGPRTGTMDDTIGSCKERHKFARPSNLALWETERILVERLRLQLQVDPECLSRHLATGSLGGWSCVRGFAMRLALVGWDSFAGNLGDSL